MSDSKKAVFERLVHEVWTEGRLGGLDALLTANHVGHMSAQDTKVTGIGEYGEMLAGYLGLYGQGRFSVAATISEGDMLACRWKAVFGEQDESPLEVLGMSFMRFENGKIAESWHSWDSLSAGHASDSSDVMDRLLTIM